MVDFTQDFALCTHCGGTLALYAGAGLVDLHTGLRVEDRHAGLVKVGNDVVHRACFVAYWEGLDEVEADG